MKVRTKIVAIVALSIVLIGGTATAALRGLQNEKIIVSMPTGATSSGDILAKTVEGATRKGAVGEVPKIFEEIGRNKGILALAAISLILGFLLSRLTVGPANRLTFSPARTKKKELHPSAHASGAGDLISREEQHGPAGAKSSGESCSCEFEKARKAIACLAGQVRTKDRELEAAVGRLKKISDVGWILTSIIEPHDLVKVVMQTAVDLVDAHRVTLHLTASGTQPETIRYIKGEEIEHLGDCSAVLRQDYPDIPIDGRRGLSTGGDAEDGAGAVFETSRLSVPLALRGQIVGAMFLEKKEDALPFAKEDLELLTTFSNHVVVAMENARLYDSLKRSYFSTIQSLVNALEASDRFTKGHSERVRLLSLELGRRMGLDFKELEMLEQASILHDIGKIGIDNFILQKQGRLTTKEYSLVKTHPLIGDEILGPIETLDEVRKTMIQHHERHDGKGYPYGLRGDEISLKSRILSVVDTFDAMMTDRPYRKAITLDRVKGELRAHSGTQFDPQVVEAFVDLLTARENELLSAAGYDALYSSL